MPDRKHVFIGQYILLVDFIFQLDICMLCNRWNMGSRSWGSLLYLSKNITGLTSSFMLTDVCVETLWVSISPYKRQELCWFCAYTTSYVNESPRASRHQIPSSTSLVDKDGPFPWMSVAGTSVMHAKPNQDAFVSLSPRIP